MNNRMKGLMLACGIGLGGLGGLVLAPFASAEGNANCTEGPGCWDPTPGPTPPPERIPIPQYLPAVWTGVEWVVPTCKVVDDDFVGCFASLPGGYRVGGMSASCPPANESCPNLWSFAFTALQYNRDAALRAASALP